MKKMTNNGVYEAPVAEVIEINVENPVLAGSGSAGGVWPEDVE